MTTVEEKWTTDAITRLFEDATIRAKSHRRSEPATTPREMFIELEAERDPDMRYRAGLERWRSIVTGCAAVRHRRSGVVHLVRPPEEARGFAACNWFACGASGASYDQLQPFPHLADALNTPGSRMCRICHQLSRRPSKR